MIGSQPVIKAAQRLDLHFAESALFDISQDRLVRRKTECFQTNVRI